MWCEDGFGDAVWCDEECSVPGGDECGGHRVVGCGSGVWFNISLCWVGFFIKWVRWRLFFLGFFFFYFSLEEQFVLKLGDYILAIVSLTICDKRVGLVLGIIKYGFVFYVC